MKYKSISQKHGVLDLQYAKNRSTSLALKYRLKRRTSEVLKAINSYCNIPPKNIIDLGTAEGRMLNEIKKKFPKSNCIGVEFNQDLIEYGKKEFPNLKFIKSDVQFLKNFEQNKFDVAIATAVIEHLEKPHNFVKQVKGILKTNGILIITAPDPFWERVATKVGHLADEQHHDVPNIKKIVYYVEKSGLEVKVAQKFMISPIGMPFEEKFETILRFFKLHFLMANQLVVAVKV